MTKEQMGSLLTAISNRVTGERHETIGADTGTAPVTLQIGFVNNICMHDGIVLIDAPSVITSVVNNWLSQPENEMVQASAGFGGLLIR